MNIFTTRISWCGNFTFTRLHNFTFKLISYDSGSIFLEIKTEENKFYYNYGLDTWFEKFVYLEIINGSQLWNYTISHDPIINESRFIKINIIIFIVIYIFNLFKKRHQSIPIVFYIVITVV